MYVVFVARHVFLTTGLFELTKTLFLCVSDCLYKTKEVIGNREIRLFNERKTYKEAKQACKLWGLNGPKKFPGRLMSIMVSYKLKEINESCTTIILCLSMDELNNWIILSKPSGGIKRQMSKKVKLLCFEKAFLPIQEYACGVHNWTPTFIVDFARTAAKTSRTNSLML